MTPPSITFRYARLAAAVMLSAISFDVTAQEKPSPKPTPSAPTTTAPAQPAATEKVEDTGYREIEQLARVIELVRQSYVDGSKVSYEQLINSALDGMLRDLDPHSQFLHPQLYQRFQQEQNSTYEGVGITIEEKNGAIVIISVREDGPAARAGILPGDQILKANETSLEKLSLPAVSRLLKGKPGEVLKLALNRPSTQQKSNVELMRQVLSEETVKDIMLLPPEIGGAGVKIGYLRLLQFSDPSPREISMALDSLEDQGMQALVIDFRNNPGGLVDAAVAIAGEFLPPGTTIVTMEGREGKPTREPYKTPARKRRPRTYPVAVLINGSSASASELVSGALQDLKRATIVGVTSYGKGSVQTMLPVEGGAAVRLTTAHYYTPSHKIIHKKGITPDLTVPMTPEEDKALFEFWKRGSTVTTNPAELNAHPDPQLRKAAESLLSQIKTPKGSPPPAKK